MYFSWYHNTNNDTILAFHYYKKFNILFEKTKYATSLKTLYLVYANVLANNRTLVYLNTGLNYDQACASLDDEEWPKYPFYYKKIKVPPSSFLPLLLKRNPISSTQKKKTLFLLIYNVIKRAKCSFMILIP